MEFFNFKSSPKRVTIKLFGPPFLFAAFLFFFTFYIVTVYLSKGTAVFGTVMLIAITVGFFAPINHYLALKNADSDWTVIVSCSRILWRAPDNLGSFSETSFDLQPSDIEKSILRLRRFHSSEDNDYVDGNLSILLNDGSEIALNCQSGINLQDFSLALEKVGIDEVREYV